MKHKRNRQIPPALLNKRIAVVCFSRSLGGLELTTLRLSNAINDRGMKTLVIVPPSSPLQQRAVASGLRVSAIEPRLKYGDLGAVFRLGKIFRKNRVDVAVLMQSKDIHLASLGSLMCPYVKLVFYQQMDSGYNKRDIFHTWVYSKLSRWITLTESMRRNVLAFTRMPPQKVDVVPLGIELKRFDPNRYTKSAARSFFKLPSKGEIVGVLGRLDPQKGQEILLRAIPALTKQHRDIHILFAGDETAGEPGYKTHLEQLGNSLSIRNRVIFLPFTDDVPRLLAALDLFVLPSYEETYGLVIIEAMAMNRAVIATNAGGVPEIVRNGKTGLLVEPRDVEGLACAVHRVLSNAKLRSAITRSARVEVQRRFEFDVCVNQLLASLASA
jgi:glycosyltransferase involved in cell wall biosynthesis